MTTFCSTLEENQLELKPESKVSVFMINIGLLCNLSCRHCHVESSPLRQENMTRETMQECLRVIQEIQPEYVDITGGAPEMNPHFEWLITQISDLNIPITLRSNLTILTTDKFKHLIPFLAQHKVDIVASLPCYSSENVDAQRGDRVFEKSITALKELNKAGYGQNKDLTLNLVYNPGGAFLPGDQASLEKAYKKELDSQFGIKFNSLFCIANMAIGRFKDDLHEANKLAAYEQTLVEAFNPQTVPNLMCRNQIHVSYDGSLYDCDFNYALKLKLKGDTPKHISDFQLESFINREINTAKHCYACTAGSGSSCTGAL